MKAPHKLLLLMFPIAFFACKKDKAPVKHVDTQLISIYNSAPAGINHPIYFSPDVRGTVISYHWDFGDNTTSASRDPEHSYKDTGVYNVTLVVNSDSALSQRLVIHIEG